VTLWCIIARGGKPFPFDLFEHFKKAIWKQLANFYIFGLRVAFPETLEHFLHFFVSSLLQFQTGVVKQAGERPPDSDGHQITPVAIVPKPRQAEGARCS
jgi:hypothetical protein